MIQKLKTFFTQPEVLVLTLSILFTALISTVVGIGGYLITGKFIGYFVITFGIQVVVFAIINTFLLRKDSIEGANIINKQLEELSKFTVRLTCSYCQQTNVVPITLNRENRFKCDGCNQVNGVKMQFFSTQITTPLTKILQPGIDESVTVSTTGTLVDPKTI